MANLNLLVNNNFLSVEKYIKKQYYGKNNIS